jgi:hypothetical protein
MKLLKNLLTLTTTSLISIIPLQASASDMIELTFQATQYQCGSNSPQVTIVADVYHNQTLIADDLAIGDSILVPSLEGLSMTYHGVNAACGFATPTELHLTKNDPIPDLPGAYDQDSIATLLSGLNEYEDLYLVELGTTNPSSFAYDLQDAVFIVNNNPVIIYPD